MPDAPGSALRPNKVLVLRQRLVDEVRAHRAGTAVVTVLVDNGRAQAVARFPSERP
jgi:hypothetical protein